VRSRTRRSPLPVSTRPSSRIRRPPPAAAREVRPIVAWRGWENDKLATPLEPPSEPTPAGAATACDRTALERGCGRRTRTRGRLAAIWRHEGAKGVWCRALARVGYRRWDRFVRPLDQPVTSRTPGVPLEIVTLAPADAAAYVAPRADATLAGYRQHLRAGRRAGRRVAGTGWWP
jgi:hypothetical protein